MDLKDKEKVVKIIGNADILLEELEKNIKDKEKKEDKQLLKSIQYSLDILKTNPFNGYPVPNKLWPKEFQDLPNLFRMELSQFYRLLYYVKGNENIVVSVVFEIVDHKKYNKIFGYRKK